MLNLEAFKNWQRDARDVVLPGPDFSLSFVDILQDSLKRGKNVVRQWKLPNTTTTCITSFQIEYLTLLLKLLLGKF